MAIFVSLDEALENPEEVTELELFGDDLRPPDLSLSPLIGRLTALERLEISNYKEVKLPDVLAQLPNLRHLCLEECNYALVPPVVWRCTQLRTLELAPDASKELPEGIGHLRHLRQLGVWGLRYLPDTLALCQQLTRLDASSCTFYTLPRSIGELSQLAQLDISHTPLEELPRWLMHLPLRELRWERGHVNIYGKRNYPLIKQIRQTWGELTQLETLSLAHQKIIDVSNHVRHWEQLHTLNLSYNDLDALPAEIGLIPKLQHLNLAFNQLMDLPQALAHHPHLETINLMANPLMGIPEVLRTLPALKEVNLMHTPITPNLQEEIKAQYPMITWVFAKKKK